MRATNDNQQSRPFSNYWSGFVLFDDLFSIKNNRICSRNVKDIAQPFAQETCVATVLRITQISILWKLWIKQVPYILPSRKLFLFLFVVVAVFFCCCFFIFKVNSASFAQPYGAIQYLLQIRWPSPVLAVFLKVIDKLKVGKRKMYIEA